MQDFASQQLNNKIQNLKADEMRGIIQGEMLHGIAY